MEFWNAITLQSLNYIMSKDTSLKCWVHLLQFLLTYAAASVVAVLYAYQLFLRVAPPLTQDHCIL